MLLINLLLVAVVIVALFIQLITPLIINIPVMALCLIALVIAIWHFRRARQKSRIPISATFTLVLQSLLFAVSVFILVAVTIPHESAHDTPAIVLGLRKFLASQGLIDMPREEAKTTASGEKAPPVTVNAPDAAKVEIRIEDDTAAKPAAVNAVNPPAVDDKKDTPPAK